MDSATRLVMLGERIARVHAQIGRNILATRGRRGLTEASAEFERTLRDLSTIAQPEIRDNYRLLRRLWDEYRGVAEEPSTPDSARRLADRNEEVAWIAGKGARFLHEQSRSPAVDFVMAAGSARSAAQRIAKLHLQRGWALPAHAGARELKAANAEIPLAIAQLKSAPEGDEAVAFALRAAQEQFALMRQAVERLGAGKDRDVQLEHIAKTADHIGESMDRLAKFHAAAAG